MVCHGKHAPCTDSWSHCHSSTHSNTTLTFMQNLADLVVAIWSNLMNRWLTVSKGPIHGKKSLEAIPVVVHVGQTDCFYAIYNCPYVWHTLWAVQFKNGSILPVFAVLSYFCPNFKNCIHIPIRMSLYSNRQCSRISIVPKLMHWAQMWFFIILFSLAIFSFTLSYI